MGLTKAREEKFHSLSRRIGRLRGILDDQVSPVGSIKRKHGHSRAVFKQRQHSLAVLENQRDTVLREITAR